MVSHEHYMKMQRDSVKQKLGTLWSSSKNYSLRKDEINNTEYYWPDIDRFSFPHQIETVKPVVTEVN